MVAEQSKVNIESKGERTDMAYSHNIVRLRDAILTLENLQMDDIFPYGSKRYLLVDDVLWMLTDELERLEHEED